MHNARLSSLAKLQYPCMAVICALRSAFPGILGSPAKNGPPSTSKSGPRVTSQLNGSVATKNGQRLHLMIDLGNIVIHTQKSNQVDYRVRLEADASQKDAKLPLEEFFDERVDETPDGVYLRGQTFGRQCRGRFG